MRPTVVDFLDAMLRDREMNLRIDEVTVPEDSPMVGKALSELHLEEMPDALLLALRHRGAWRYNPRRSTDLQPGLVLVFLGTPGDIDMVRQRVGGSAASPSSA